MHKGLYIIGLLLLFVACTGDREVRALLEQAETANKLYKPLPSDTVFQKVVDYYDRHGDANERMKAYYLMGCIYRDRHEAPMALQWYLDAVEQADTLAADCDYLTLMKVYGQMADIYHSQLMPSEEIEAYRHFSKCAEKMDSTYYAIRGIEKQLGAYQLMSDTAMILALTDSVHNLYQKAGMPQAAASVYYAVIHIYLARYDYSKAKQLMDTFEQESGLFDAEGNICQGREHYYESKGIYYEGIGKLDSAKYYYHLLADNGYSLDAYRGLIQVFRKQQLADSILATVQRYEQAYQNYVNYKDIDAMRQVKSMYDYSRNQKIAYQKDIEAKNKQIVIIILCFFITLTIYAITYLYRKRKRLYLKAIKLIGQEKNAKWKVINRAERQAIQLSQKRETISSLETKNKELRSQLHPRNCLTAETMLLDSKEVKAITKYVSESGTPTGEEWKNLERAFMKYLPKFYYSLKAYQLNKLEMRICMLSFLEIEPSIISILTKRTSQHISRLRGKLFDQLSDKVTASNLDIQLKLLSESFWH